MEDGIAVLHQTYVVQMKEIVMWILNVLVVLFVEQITVHQDFIIQDLIVAKETQLVSTNCF